MTTLAEITEVLKAYRDDAWNRGYRYGLDDAAWPAERELRERELREINADLLAALKRALEDFGPDYQGPTIDAMRAAIAKAEGRP